MPEIKLGCDWCSVETLERLLATEIEPDSDVTLSIRDAAHTFRSPTAIDPTVLVAVVGGTSAAVSALITGLFRVLEKKRDKSATITLRGADGTKVIAPANATKEQLEELAALASRLSRPSVHLTGSQTDIEVS
jgi:hypothetical protein